MNRSLRQSQVLSTWAQLLMKVPSKRYCPGQAQTTEALTRLKPIWNDSFSLKMRLMRSRVTSIFLYNCESWPHSRAPKKNTSHGNELLPKYTTHLIQRSCYQRGSPQQDPAGNRNTRGPLGHRKET